MAKERPEDMFINDPQMMQKIMASNPYISYMTGDLRKAYEKEDMWKDKEFLQKAQEKKISSFSELPAHLNKVIKKSSTISKAISPNLRKALVSRGLSEANIKDIEKSIKTNMPQESLLILNKFVDTATSRGWDPDIQKAPYNFHDARRKLAGGIARKLNPKKAQADEAKRQKEIYDRMAAKYPRGKAPEAEDTRKKYYPGGEKFDPNTGGVADAEGKLFNDPREDFIDPRDATKSPAQSQHDKNRAHYARAKVKGTSSAEAERAGSLEEKIAHFMNIANNATTGEGRKRALAMAETYKKELDSGGASSNEGKSGYDRIKDKTKNLSSNQWAAVIWASAGLLSGGSLVSILMMGYIGYWINQWLTNKHMTPSQASATAKAVGSAYREASQGGTVPVSRGAAQMMGEAIDSQVSTGKPITMDMIKQAIADALKEQQQATQTGEPTENISQEDINAAEDIKNNPNMSVEDLLKSYSDMEDEFDKINNWINPQDQKKQDDFLRSLGIDPAKFQDAMAKDRYNKNLDLESLSSPDIVAYLKELEETDNRLQRLMTEAKRRESEFGRRNAQSIAEGKGPLRLRRQAQDAQGKLDLQIATARAEADDAQKKVDKAKSDRYIMYNAIERMYGKGSATKELADQISELDNEKLYAWINSQDKRLARQVKEEVARGQLSLKNITYNDLKELKPDKVANLIRTPADKEAFLNRIAEDVMEQANAIAAKNNVPNPRTIEEIKASILNFPKVKQVVSTSDRNINRDSITNKKSDRASKVKAAQEELSTLQPRTRALVNGSLAQFGIPESEIQGMSDVDALKRNKELIMEKDLDSPVTNDRSYFPKLAGLGYQDPETHRFSDALKNITKRQANFIIENKIDPGTLSELDDRLGVNLYNPKYKELIDKYKKNPNDVSIKWPVQEEEPEDATPQQQRQVSRVKTPDDTQYNKEARQAAGMSHGQWKKASPEKRSVALHEALSKPTLTHHQKKFLTEMQSKGTWPVQLPEWYTKKQKAPAGNAPVGNAPPSSTPQPAQQQVNLNKPPKLNEPSERGTPGGIEMPPPNIDDDSDLQAMKKSEGMKMSSSLHKAMISINKAMETIKKETPWVQEIPEGNIAGEEDEMKWLPAALQGGGLKSLIGHPKAGGTITEAANKVGARFLQGLQEEGKGESLVNYSPKQIGLAILEALDGMINENDDGKSGKSWSDNLAKLISVTGKSSQPVRNSMRKAVAEPIKTLTDKVEDMRTRYTEDTEGGETDIYGDAVKADVASLSGKGKSKTLSTY